MSFYVNFRSCDKRAIQHSNLKEKRQLLKIFYHFLLLIVNFRIKDWLLITEPLLAGNIGNF